MIRVMIRKNLCSFMALILMTLALCTPVFETLETDHECGGQHCPVCETLSAAHGVKNALQPVSGTARAITLRVFEDVRITCTMKTSVFSDNMRRKLPRLNI